MKLKPHLSFACLLFVGLTAAEARANLEAVQQRAATRGDKVARRITTRSTMQLLKRHTLKGTMRAMKLHDAVRAMLSPLHYGTSVDYIEFRRVVGATAVGQRHLTPKRVSGTRRDMAQLYRAVVRYGLVEVMDMAQSHVNAERHGISSKTLAKDAQRLLPRVERFLSYVDPSQLLKTEEALLVGAQKARDAMARRAGRGK